MTNPSSPSSSPSATATTAPPRLTLLGRYALPLLLMSLGLVFQLFVLPSSFPPSHYDVLGVRRLASMEEVAEAYEKLSSRWSSGLEIPTAMDFIKIRYAFELLTNPLWKRDYDIFDIDEQLHVVGKLKEQYEGESYSKVLLPLLEGSSSDPIDHALSELTPEGFMSNVGKNKTWLIQVYSSGSPRSKQFSSSWKRITSLLDGVANTGMVELGEVQLASFLAEMKSTGHPFFRNGLPALVAFPPNCRSSDCYVSYEGDLAVDAIVDWVATTIIGLPRILYYSKESLGQDFIAKSGLHKVKVIFFSKTGERAVPFLRQAAKDYWAYSSFALVLWREEESSIWWNTFQVESAPAIMFLKDPGVKPVVYHGTFNSAWFVNTMEENKYQDLPQLRSVTSMELGCDARGYSRAGNDTRTWYCVILAGRLSLELNNMRGTMRRVQNILMDDSGLNIAGEGVFSVPAWAADALKDKRLTFAWLDGEAQKKYCFFYLFSESSYETCGPRRYGDPTDVPKVFIVRYQRNTTESEIRTEKKTKNIWDALQEDDSTLASQLVARYNGSEDISEILQWISHIIEDGDTRNLPYFRMDTPELIPEDKEPIWSKSARGILSRSKGVKKWFQSTFVNIYDHMGDPRLGPILLLGACISFGTIWLQNSQTTLPAEISGGSRSRTRNHMAATPHHDRPSSITDAEPKDAYQMLTTDSNSE